MRILILAMLVGLAPLAALAADAVSGDALRLEDGREVRLIGIKADGNAAKAALQHLIDHQKLLLESSGADRYGRVAADVYVQDEKGRKLWVQGELLKQGLAFVYPPTGSEPHLADLMKAEQEARQAKRGIWNDAVFADKPADAPDDLAYGTFAFISGKVVKAERIKNMVYLNFGKDWHNDFTIAIAAHDLRLFDKVGIDPLTYEGKTLRVRGWIKRNFGPTISVTHPAQIEVLKDMK